MAVLVAEVTLIPVPAMLSAGPTGPPGEMKPSAMFTSRAAAGPSVSTRSAGLPVLWNGPTISPPKMVTAGWPGPGVSSLAGSGVMDSTASPVGRLAAPRAARSLRRPPVTSRAATLLARSPPNSAVLP